MEQNKKPRKQKSIAPVLVALSVIAIVSILVYKNQDEVTEIGQSLIKKGKSTAKKGLEKSSVVKDGFNDLIESLEKRIRKAVA